MARNNSFLSDLYNEEITGVAYKNLQLKKSILSWFANQGSTTIADLSKVLNVSSPKIAELINELMEAGLVKDYGKTESTVGRRPNLYGLESNSLFFLGVEVKNNYINIGLLNFQKELVKFQEKIPYELSNTAASLDELCRLISQFIKELKGVARKISSICINLSGRINYRTGYSYSYFYFNEEPLTRIIERKLGVKTYVENDSRSMAYGEFCNGVVKNEKNVIFINADYGIALGVMINGELYYGKSGFSGEFGHIPFFENEILCHCGKKGCLETETSGQALVRQFKQRLSEGATSGITRKIAVKDITLEDILDAANHDDTLAIELIAAIGEKLGKGIAILINLYNPELIILGGALSATGETIFLPLRSAINKYSLSLVNNDTQYKLSKLGSRAGVIGASLLARNKLFDML
ncbi:Sugar kinase of the NBD/HSP70 family, may contain an N-terminal HTH domain [Chitinophaga eiseniae]|uniref:Sugar kinase of the NBD/HSP70 family, may contain an N-terminal HTH domain n=1 Tax=Chitinophaga eiseniae TaxID=634771 RepID=A0A1T4PYK3_9BACT|nr:ROK family transcriptional regulator [Chitinophaga eiseniae]SJZ96529.1 Sugar kinase of the NBD/HSP70 family, may contain an N-terminal HTH domain [Chitinophaga eiseniae]